MAKDKTFSVYQAGPKKFYVVTYENRKRVYVNPDPKATTKHFSTRAAAERAQKKLQAKANAMDYRALSPLQRREYWELVSMARAHGLSLREAIEKGCGRSTSWPERIQTHKQAFLEYCQHTRKLRRSSIEFYTNKLNVLFAGYPQATFGDFPAHRLKELIQSFGNGSEWEKGAVRAISAFWNWGSKLHPPISPYGITKSISLDHAKTERSIEFLTIAEAARFLHHASSRWSRDAFALMMFAGIRKNEVEQMRWEWIDFEKRVIYIPAHVSKTSGRPPIETAPDVLWDWITPERAAKAGAFICSHKLKDQVKSCARASLIPSWPSSCLRHTFITYHYAAYKDAAATRAISGHDEDARTLEQRYRGVSVQRDGRTYLPLMGRAQTFLRLTPDLCATIATGQDIPPELAL